MAGALPATVDDAPTRVRHGIVLVTVLSAMLLYLDRFCISFAEVYIKEDLGLSDTQVAIMLGAFFSSYALAQVPSGWLSDRYGARMMLTAYILLWSLFTGLTGLAWSFATLLVLRLAFGLAQAGAYPTAASLVSKWVPFTNRGTASSAVAFGGRVGGALAPVLTAYLIIQLVPLETSSRLARGDVLNPRQFAQQLQQPEQGDAPVAEYLLDHFSTEARSAVGRLAQTSRPPLNSGEVDSLVAGLNEVLSRDELHQVVATEELSLPLEAKRLLELSPGARTSAQTERLNRLLLEAVYPKHIRKVYRAGWRPTMMVYGLIGILVAGVFWIFLRDRPEVHPRCNAAEVELIASSRPPGTPSTYGRVQGVPLWHLITSRSMWLCCASQVGTNVGWVFLVTWLPRYLDEVHQVPVVTRGWMTAAPLFVGWFGMLCGGRLTDLLVRKLGLRRGRALPMGLTRFMAMAAYLFCLLPLSQWAGAWTPWLVTLAFCLVAFSTDLGTGSVWAFNQDVGGRYVGSVLGWGNMWGNLGAAVSPWLLIWIVGDGSGSEPRNWSLAFVTCAAAFFVAGVAALGVDATRPIVPEDRHEQA